MDALLAEGVIIERPCRPTSMEVSSDEKDLCNASSYPIKVRVVLYPRVASELSTVTQVALKRLNDSDNAEDEVVHAKFVVGADGNVRTYVRNVGTNNIAGAHSWVRRTLGINMEGENTGVLSLVVKGS